MAGRVIERGRMRMRTASAGVQIEASRWRRTPFAVVAVMAAALSALLPAAGSLGAAAITPTAPTTATAVATATATGASAPTTVATATTAIAGGAATSTRAVATATGSATGVATPLVGTATPSATVAIASATASPTATTRATAAPQPTSAPLRASGGVVLRSAGPAPVDPTAPLAVAGRVVDDTGGVAAVSITARRRPTEQESESGAPAAATSAVADAGGWFSLTLAPGDWDVTAATRDGREGRAVVALAAGGPPPELSISLAAAPTATGRVTSQARSQCPTAIYTLSGNVTYLAADGTLKPSSGATVSASWPGGTSSCTGETFSVRTDASGNYTLFVGTGIWRIAVDSGFYDLAGTTTAQLGTEVAQIVGVSADVPNVNFAPPVQPMSQLGLTTLSGTLKFPDGSVAGTNSGYRVCADGTDNRWRVTCGGIAPDSAGAFSLPLPPGRYTLRVTMDGDGSLRTAQLPSAEYVVPSTGLSLVDARLLSSATVRVRLRTPNGGAIAGRSVTLSQQTGSGDGKTQRLSCCTTSSNNTTGSDGAISYQNQLPAGLYRVNVTPTPGSGTAPGMLGYELFRDVPVGASTLDLTLPDESALPTISGTVRDPATGAPVVNATVSSNMYDLTYGFVTASTNTDSAGAFALRAMSGVWSLSVSASGYTSISNYHVNVGSSNVGGVTLTLRALGATPTATPAASAQIRGFVKDAAGNAIVGATVSTTDPVTNQTAAAYTQADGSYLFYVVPNSAGSIWTVNVSTGARALLGFPNSFARVTSNSSNRAGTSVTDGGAIFDFTLPAKSSFANAISGTLKWPDASNAYGRSVSVAASPTPGTGVQQIQSISATTQLDGSFSFAVPAGSWSLTASGETRREFGSPAALTANTAGGGVSGQVLTLAAPLGSYSGTVTEQGAGTSAPIPGASVSLSYNSVNADTSVTCCSNPSTIAGANGAYTIYLFATPAATPCSGCSSNSIAASRSGMVTRTDSSGITVAASTTNSRAMTVRQKTRVIAGQVRAAGLAQPGITVRSNYSFTAPGASATNFSITQTTDGAGMYAAPAWPDTWTMRLSGICNVPNGVGVTVGSSDAAGINFDLTATTAGDPACTTTTFAGAGNFGGDLGQATSARLALPQGVAVAADAVYIADNNNNRIRKLTLSTGVITTVAGTVDRGFSGDGGPATSAQLAGPRSVRIGPDGLVYFVDNSRVRRIDSSGNISTVVGGGSSLGDNGPATSAQLNDPWGIAFGPGNTLYIADRGNQRVRKVSSLDGTGTITTVAGTGSSGFSGDSGQATSAQLRDPYGVAVASDGTFYIADRGNRRVRRVDMGGVITTIAGDGNCGSSGDNGPAASAQLCSPRDVVVRPSDGSLLIADEDTYSVRRISAPGATPPGTITRVAGTNCYGYGGDGGVATSACMTNPIAIALASDDTLYIVDRNNNRIRKVASGTISTAAGSGSFGGDAGTAANANLGNVSSVAAASDGTIYLADWNNFRIRKITPSGSISTVVGTGSIGCSGGDNVAATTVQLSQPRGVRLGPDGSLYVMDGGCGLLRKISANGVSSIVAGGGSPSTGNGDGGPATSAQLSWSNNVTVAPDGTIYIAESGANRIRKITPGGTISTVAGTGGSCGSADGAATTTAQLCDPYDIALAPDGGLYIADRGNNKIRKLSPDGSTVSTFAGTGSCCYTPGDDIPALGARFNGPQGLQVGADGSLFVADPGNQRIRKITPDGFVTSIAGTGGYDFTGDGGAATSARFAAPRGIALDTAGNLYIADSDNFRIRKVLAVTAPGPAAVPALSLASGWNLSTLRAVPSGAVPSPLPAAPVSSSTFFIAGGSVTLNGSPAPAGTLVQAVCRGTTVAGQVLTGSGSGQAANAYSLTVFGNDSATAAAANYCASGDTVYFRVNGLPATAQVTSGSSTWSANGNAVVNLSASTSLTPSGLVNLSAGAIDVIVTFDAASGQARSYFVDPAKAVLNNLTTIEAGTGYWLHTTRAASVPTGTAVPSTISRSLVSGWNLVGWQGADRRVPSIAFSSLGSGWDAVLGFDPWANPPTARAYFTDPAKSLLNNLTNLEIGAGYWVHTTQTGTWTYTP